MMVNKKVIIIGEGISGLTVGSYLQMNDYNTEIFKKHYLPGGLPVVGKEMDRLIPLIGG